MPLYRNGTNIANTSNIYIQGQTLTNVVHNGTTVWTKQAAGGWKNIWSGQLFIAPDILDIYDEIDYTGEEYGVIPMQAFYTNMSDTVIDGFELSLDASIYEIEMDYETEEIYREEEVFYIEKSESSKVSNVPVTIDVIQSQTTVHKPVKQGSTVIQNVDIGWSFWGSRLFFNMVEIQNLYKYIP